MRNSYKYFLKDFAVNTTQRTAQVGANLSIKDMKGMMVQKMILVQTP